MQFAPPNAALRFGSVCSGIEAASVAWHPLGWKAAWLSEIEPFPSAVLQHHYPDVPNLGDMTALPERITSGEIEAPDLFCGGTPCQAFSVAGLRKSLDDARGNLSLVFCEIANAIDSARNSNNQPPAIIFWENVPGVLSTKDNAFGCFLAGLAGEDTPLEPTGGKWTNAGVVLGPQRAVAWRILDAQYFGVAQRRRRVFVVASARDGFDPASVLFEFDGLRRDSAPSREAREVAPTIPSRSTAGGGLGTDFDLDGGVIRAFGGNNTSGPIDQAAALNANRGCHNPGDFEAGTLLVQKPISYGIRTANTSSNGWGIQEEVTHTLDCAQGVAATQPIAHVDTMPTLRAGAPAGGPGHGARSGDSKDEYIVPVGRPIGFNARQDPDSWTERTGPLDTDGGTQAIAFQPGNLSRGAGASPSTEVFPTLKSDHGRGQSDQDPHVAVCVTSNYGKQCDNSDTALGPNVALQAMQVLAPVRYGDHQQDTLHHESGIMSTLPGGSNNNAGHYTNTVTAMQVRRLTPVECERLQGFPDGYTAIPWRKKPAEECPDGPRYKALGNSWAVPVVRWIGSRIQSHIATTNASFFSPSSQHSVASQT